MVPPTKNMGKAKEIKTRDPDDDDADSLDPYSDELDVSSPELLETGEGGDGLREEGEDDWEDEVSLREDRLLVLKKAGTNYC
jgi:hypothetical protein